jgi:uncharacterized protein
MFEPVVRSTALDDAPLEVSRSGDGRTITGYVAVFDTVTRIRDIHGTYDETNARSAFNKSIADRGTKFLVTYNHGMTLYGTPSSEFSVPLGVARSVTPDERGVLVEIAVDKTPLGDAILEGARSGSIPGMSYTGGLVRSTPEKPRGGYRIGRDGQLPLVTRLEIAMREFGPTPTPAFDAAQIVGVRSLVASIEGLNPNERAELIELLSRAHDLSSATSEPADDSTSPEAATPDEPPTGALRSASPISPAERIARIRRVVSGVSPGK